MTRRYILPGVFAVAFSILSLVTTGWWSGFLSNLGAGFFGSLLTVWLIDRAMEKSRAQQVLRVKRAAFDRIRRYLCLHTQLLFNMHKASAASGPKTDPTSIGEIFTDDYYQALRRLDFSRPAPILPTMNWFSFVASEIREFQSALERMVDTYVAFLDPEDVEQFEKLRSSPLLSFLMQAANMPQVDHALGFHNRPYNVLAHESVIPVVREHVECFESLLLQFNKYGSKSISISELQLWRPDVSPVPGSARGDGPLG